MDLNPVKVKTGEMCPGYVAADEALKSEQKLQIKAAAKRAISGTSIVDVMTGRFARQVLSGQTPDMVKVMYTERGQRIIQERDACPDCINGITVSDNCGFALKCLTMSLRGEDLFDQRPVVPESDPEL